MSESRQINTEQPQRWWLIPTLVGLFFVVGLWVFFPAQTVKLYLEQELTRQLQRPVSIGNVELNLPATLAISTLETMATAEIPIQLTYLTVAPNWPQIFKGKPTVKFHGKTFGGTVTAQLDTVHHIQFEATALRLDIPIPKLPTLRIQTTIDQLDASGFVKPLKQLEQLDLWLSKLQVIGLKQVGFPANHLNLGSVHLQLSQNKQRLAIDQLTSRAGDLIINGRGHVTLQHNLLHSPIDLTLTLSPRTGLDPAITTLLPLFAKQQNTGRYTIHIGGTLAQPQLNDK